MKTETIFKRVNTIWDNINIGDEFIGNINHVFIKIIDVTNTHVLYRVEKNNKIFNFGKKAFEHLQITKIS